MNDQNENQGKVFNYKSTPPNSKRRIRNPFDKALIGRLHKPICSPGMCKIYKKQRNGLFRWEIDQACTLVPADIVACTSQFEPSPDPVLDKIAEEATEQFFSQEMIMSSPLDSSKKTKPLQVSYEESIEFSSKSLPKHLSTTDVSAQTVLTFPPFLPPELEKLMETYCTFTQDQNISGEYEITANGSLRRKLLFEEHNDIEHYDSEQTDDEIHADKELSSCEHHTPVLFSPDHLSRDALGKGMTRTFGTPLSKTLESSRKSRLCNKVFDVVDNVEPCFSPITFCTPQRYKDNGTKSGTSSSLASESISPVDKITSSDEEKNNFSSPEVESMGSCLDCRKKKQVVGDICYCKMTPDRSILRRSASLKESPYQRQKKLSSFSEKRSLSMSSLNRSRSVQKLDFNMDMSVDDQSPKGGSEVTHSPQKVQLSWSLEELTDIQYYSNTDYIASSHSKSNNLAETPVKGKSKSSVMSHVISQIRKPSISASMNMSLDSSMEHIENPLHLEDRKIDFNNVDLKLLTDVTNFDVSSKLTNVDNTCSFKKVDSGFDNMSCISSYYESAIKRSELTVLADNTKETFIGTTSVNWMRADSGFKDDNSSDSMQFYANHEAKKLFLYPNNKDEKENTISDEYTFTDDMTFNCNFSSTPSKTKNRNVNY